MVKTKKKNLSESVQHKSKKQLNPFEVHINRDKQKVLGRKSKNDRGLPGVSRAKAINRRKQNLLQEYKLQNKDNVFLDRRIGEQNCAMSMEDKAIARFTTERMKVYKKESIFNLNDEILTHRGQTLEEIEKFDDPRSDDEFSDSVVNGKLDKNFIEKAHFGGGTLSKADSTLSRKDLIDQLIMESKKRKAEKQKMQEQMIDLTEKLDSEWRDLLPFMSASKKSMKDDDMMKADTYDIAVRQLKFETRGTPSEKLKSEEEIIQEEKEKLERLEGDRLARMKGFLSDTSNQYRHKSIDDLEDSFIMEIIGDEVNSVTIDTDNINNEKSSNKIDDFDYQQKENKLRDIANEEIVKNTKTRNDNKNQEKYSKSDLTDLNDKDSKIENFHNKKSEDSFSNLKLSGSCSEDEGETQVIFGKKKNMKHVTFTNDLTKDTKQVNQSDKISLKSILKQSSSIQNSDENEKQQIRNDLLKRKEIMENARKELPYTYNAPKSFEELETLLKPHNADYQSVIVDRIIKCNHWTLDGGNREKMSNLFIYLLQYINNCASTKNVDNLIKCFQIFDRYRQFILTNFILQMCIK